MRAFAALILCAAATAALAAPVRMTWPTPSKAWSDGESIGAYVQHAGSGDPQSGTFGGVRSGGAQFHEGLDIKPVSRNRRGEALDDIFAAMDGVVRHISARSGDSNYGRYIVLEHPEQTPAVYTLYAHLSRIAPGLQVGSAVRAGQAIGTMGNSSDRPFPKERAHLHFEIGVMVTRNFQAWYNRKGFGSRNEQGHWNGMNLMGIDPLAVFEAAGEGRLESMLGHFQRMPVAVRVRIATHQTPDFVTRYPAFLTKPLPMGPVAGWDIAFNWTGVPIAWTPLTAMEVVGLPLLKPQIMSADADIERRQRSRTLVVRRRGTWVIGSDLDTVLEQLFGLK